MARISTIPFVLQCACVYIMGSLSRGIEMRKSRRACVGLTAIILASACVRFGGAGPGDEQQNIVTIAVTSTGERLTFLLVPQETWSELGGREWLGRGRDVARYEAGRTPQRRLTRRTGVYVVAWRCGSAWEVDRVTAVVGTTNVVEIGCPP